MAFHFGKLAMIRFKYIFMKFTKTSILTILLIISAFILSFFVYKNISEVFNRYKKVKISSVNAQELEYSGFKKIELENLEFYVPFSWSKLNDENVYSDVIFGSELRINSTERTLGNVSAKGCNSLHDAKISQSTDLQLKKIQNKVVKLTDYKGCLMESEFKKDKEYTVKDFIIFRKEKIYTFTSAFQKKLTLESENSDKVFRSIYIKE